jgi:hypothetical protein
LRFFQILNHGSKESSSLAAGHTAMIEAEREGYAPVYLDTTHDGHDIVL